MTDHLSSNGGIEVVPPGDETKVWGPGSDRPVVPASLKSQKPSFVINKWRQTEDTPAVYGFKCPLCDGFDSSWNYDYVWLLRQVEIHLVNTHRIDLDLLVISTKRILGG